MNPSTSLGTRSNVGMAKPSPPVRQAGNIWCLLEIHGVCRRSVPSGCAQVKYKCRCRVTSEDLLKQRIFQIAAGYEDANDANTLRHDPIFKLLLDRLPETGAPLASQPTISRFENSISRTEIYRMALVLMDQFIASY